MSHLKYLKKIKNMLYNYIFFLDSKEKTYSFARDNLIQSFFSLYD